ncbi:MAG: UDP-GlcNAc:undecaprenyl-phosphate GlcNAc-1-phosphate transferase [Bacteroidia bacterium]|jgi:UDP-GlcNAc:undecaprenyl-phosphate GlcNAc-1-phosphate transferase
MNEILQFSTTPVMAFIMVLVLIQPIRRLAKRVGLVDKPNSRKTHQTPVPVIGGILIFIATVSALLLNAEFLLCWEEYRVLLVGTIVLLFLGVIDDRVELGAKLKLIIQIGVAYYVFSSGVKIESLHGVFGVHILPYYVQFILTMVVIIGTVNAFNLTDGIDGLVAGFAIIGLTAFAVLAYLLGQPTLALIFVTVVSSLIVFLRFNLSKKSKIFMGDAGSLILGYVLVVSGIMLIQTSQTTEYENTTILSVIGVLIIPVFDSLRVYRGRIKKGYSPFRADRTHLHHLLLSFQVEHYVASFVLFCIGIFVLVFTLLTGAFFSLTITIAVFVVLFGLFSKVLSLNHQLHLWSARVLEMENQRD